MSNGDPPVDQRRGGVYVAGLIDRDERSKTWKDWIIPAVVSGFVGAVVLLGQTYGGKISGGETTQAVLSERLASLADDNKDHKKILEGISAKQQDIYINLSRLYTREEAQRDREAAERRFQSFETELREVKRRLEIVEGTSRLLQQTITDRDRGWSNSPPKR